MEIKKLNLQNKKGAAIAINKTVTIILVILVIAIAIVAVVKINLSKWLGFLPDYGSQEQTFEACDLKDNCEVISSECICTNQAGAYDTCVAGQYCYENDEGCQTEEPDWYKGQMTCKK